MTITSNTFRATDSLYANPILFESQEFDCDYYDEPVFYNSEFERIKKHISLFLNLEKGWDGYSAVAPKEETLENVLCILQNIKDKYLKLLDNEDIIPSPYGTISLYFNDFEDNELSVEFGAKYIGISGEINGKIIIIDNLPIYKFELAIDEINKLKIAN